MAKGQWFKVQGDDAGGSFDFLGTASRIKNDRACVTCR